MERKTLFVGAALALAAAISAGAAQAQPFNQPPPAGAILDLNGQPITNIDQGYSVEFTAALANTAITFAFRQDPAFLSFSNAALIDLTTSSGNLLVDGDFSGGTIGTSTATGWTYANIYGATYGGVVESGCGLASTNCWYDGAVQAYDAISQTVATNPGDVYQISFNLNGGGFGNNPGFYSDLSTNGDITDTGGTGIDVLAYAQAGLPVAGTVPEPAAWALMLVGFGSMGALLRARRRQALVTA